MSSDYGFDFTLASSMGIGSGEIEVWTDFVKGDITNLVQNVFTIILHSGSNGFDNILLELFPFKY